MTVTDVLEELRRAGTEQNRKVYRRYGTGEEVLGVSFAKMNELKKAIKVDHDLAERLWESGYYEARTLATMIADPARSDEATLRRWASELKGYPLADALAGLACRTDSARALAEAWTLSEDELLGRIGWDLVGQRALRDANTPDEYFLDRLSTIERRIHDVKNFTRYAMNNALIAIGMRNPRLEEAAVAAARRIGKVEVDHGETSCETPDAIDYIERVKERRLRLVAARRT